MPADPPERFGAGDSAHPRDAQLPTATGGFLTGRLLVPLLATLYLAALHTAIRGENLGSGLATVYVVAGLILVVGYVLLVGVRRTPRWTDGLLLGLVLGVIMLEVEEWWAVGGLLGVGLWTWAAAVSPLAAMPKRVRRARFGSSQLAGDLGARPLAGSAAADAAMADETGDPRLPIPDPSRRPTDLEPWVVQLLPNRSRPWLVLAAVFLAAVTGVCGVMVVQGARDGDPALAVVAGLFGLFTGALAVGVVLAALSPAQELVIDHHGISRHGAVAWELRWEEVGAIGVRIRTRGKSTDTHLMLVLHDREAGDRIFIRGWVNDRLAPFTHSEPFPPLGAQIPTQTAAALNQRVPDLFVGLVRD